MEPQISTEEVKKRLEKKEILLIDVRERVERDIAKIEDSLFIPLNQLQLKLEEVKKQANGRDVVVYCHHGFRSQFGAELLRRNGIKAASMTGGIDEWSKKIDKKVRQY